MSSVCSSPIALEQTVEFIHHRHQRHELQEDLHNEAEQNLQIIDRDLKMQNLEPWFGQVTRTATAASLQRNTVRISPRRPVFPAPSAPPSSATSLHLKLSGLQPKESGLVVLLPVEQSRMQARLAHNYDLLADAREHAFAGCQTIIAMHQRFTQPAPNPGAPELWTMTSDQTDHLAATAADTKIAIQGLLFRLRWSKVYEQGIMNGESAADIKMMTINQERFEDPPAH